MTLISPQSWEDRNDAYYLERYQAEKKTCGTVLAVCFSLHTETFHHWRIFSSGASGVCIEFDKSELLKSFPGKKGFLSGKVEYFPESPKIAHPLNTWPFVKLNSYEDEREYRIIFESTLTKVQFKWVKINLASIRRITLSPWLPATVAAAVSSIVRSMPKCAALEVIQSRLTNNDNWKAVIDPTEAPERVMIKWNEALGRGDVGYVQEHTAPTGHKYIKSHFGSFKKLSATYKAKGLRDLQSSVVDVKPHSKHVCCVTYNAYYENGSIKQWTDRLKFNGKVWQVLPQFVKHMSDRR